MNELLELIRGTNSERYLEWERKFKHLFEFKAINDEKSCIYAILRLSRGASLWYEGMKAKRAQQGKKKITS